MSLRSRPAPCSRVRAANRLERVLGMVLSDHTIKLEMAAGRIVVEPCDPDDIQPSSVDLHLGDDFQVFRNSRYPYIDPSREQTGPGRVVLPTLLEADRPGRNPGNRNPA